MSKTTTQATPPLQGTGPSEVLLAHPELRNANTAAAPVPVPFKPAPWWRCVFRRWGKLEFVQTITYKRRDPGRDWEWKIGVLYRQIHRRTGQKRYGVSVFGYGVMRIDADAWEREGKMVFL